MYNLYPTLDLIEPLFLNEFVIIINGKEGN